MLKLISNNDSPKISSLRVRRHATSPIEAEEIFSQNSEGHVMPVDMNSMPYTESQSELSEQDQPTLKKFKAGEEFRLAVYNLSTNLEVPFVGFSIERIRDDEDIFIEGSTNIIDPSKSKLTKPAIALIPLLHLFNAPIKAEAKRAANLIARVSGNQNTISLADERDKRMMDFALTATHNVMQALYGHEESEEVVVEQPRTGTDCLVEKLHPTLDASSSFYEALMHKTRDLFEPSIRTLAESVALGRVNANETVPVRTI